MWHFNVAAASTAADELAVSADDVDRVVACPGPDGVGLPSWTAVEHPTSSPLLISTAISGLNTSPESHAAAPAARTEGRRPGTRRALGVHTRQLWSAGSIGAGHQPAASPPTAKATVRLRIDPWVARLQLAHAVGAVVQSRTEPALLPGQPRPLGEIPEEPFQSSSVQPGPRPLPRPDRVGQHAERLGCSRVEIAMRTWRDCRRRRSGRRDHLPRAGHHRWRRRDQGPLVGVRPRPNHRTPT